jgi:hypothetical protein
MCIIIIISTIPSFIPALAMEEEKRDGKHFITDCKTDQRQKEVERCSLIFSGFTCYYCTSPVRLYSLLISILLCTIPNSWLSVRQASRAADVVG